MSVVGSLSISLLGLLGQYKLASQHTDSSSCAELGTAQPQLVIVYYKIGDRSKTFWFKENFDPNDIWNKKNIGPKIDFGSTEFFSKKCI